MVCVPRTRRPTLKPDFKRAFRLMLGSWAATSSMAAAISMPMSSIAPEDARKMPAMKTSWRFKLP